MNNKGKLFSAGIFFFLLVLVVGGLLLFAVFLNDGIPFVSNQDEWSVSIYEGTPILLEPFDNAPVLTGKFTDKRNAFYIADPFIVSTNGTYQLFFELSDKYNHGDIALAESNDAMKWTYRQVVLDESFHLSYPYVFEHNGEFFMIPQSSSQSVRLYKAVNYPHEWDYVQDILTGNYTDSTFVFHNSTWYMFTSADKGKTMKLFFSDSLEGNWTEHPKSPVYVDNAKYSRCGGRITEFDGCLIRYAQDGEQGYGTTVHAMNITILSKTDFAEEQIETQVLGASQQSWNKDGMHHVSPLKIGSKWIAAVDGKRNHIMFGWNY